MKSSEDNIKPISHYIHQKLYKKQCELNGLKRKHLTPLDVIKAKRDEVYELERKFRRQIEWENYGSKERG